MAGQPSEAAVLEHHHDSCSVAKAAHMPRRPVARSAQVHRLDLWQARLASQRTSWQAASARSSGTPQLIIVEPAGVRW